VKYPGKYAWQAIQKGLIAIILLVGIVGLAVPAEARHFFPDSNPSIASNLPLNHKESHRAPNTDLVLLDSHLAPAPRDIETISRTVSVTIEVTVPEFTPGTVYIFGSQPELGDWNPSAVPMTQSGADTWLIALDFPEDTPLGFNFGRGSQYTEESEQDGNTSVPARELTVTYGTDGVQSASYEVANWRDPVVVDHFPRDGASSLPIDTTISVSWSQPMGVGTDFLVMGPGGPVSGTFTYYANTYTYVFEPAELLNIGATYAISVTGQTDAGQDVQQVPVQFAFDTMVPTSVDLVVLAEKESITDSWWWVSWPWLMVLLSVIFLSGLVWIKRRRTVLSGDR
jgi:hypothetical protein